MDDLDLNDPTIIGVPGVGETIYLIISSLCIGSLGFYVFSIY